MVGDGFEGGGGGECLGEQRLGAGAGPVELRQVVGELLYLLAEGVQVDEAQGAVIGGGHRTGSPGT